MEGTTDILEIVVIEYRLAVEEEVRYCIRCILLLYIMYINYDQNCLM
jgi:hypothetical protein